MTEYHIGFTLKLEKKKKPFAVAGVFYDKGSHMIEFHSPEDATKIIKGLIPPYPGEMQTPTQETPPKAEHEKSGGSGGIG